MGVTLSRVRFSLVPPMISLFFLILGAKNYRLEYIRQTDDGMSEFKNFVAEYMNDDNIYVLNSIHLFSVYTTQNTNTSVSDLKKK